MSQENYRTWLLSVGFSPNSAVAYSAAINRISEHYSANTGQLTNIYEVYDIDSARNIADKYRQGGVFAEFGYKNSGLHRAAILKYVEYLEQAVVGGEAGEPVVEDVLINLLTYEKDLKYALCNQIAELFPGYKIYGQNKEGIEYTIEGKRIDVLLEHASSSSLLAIELKSGIADFRVFGQIAMYIGMLKNKFPERKVEGLIISGAIDDSLKQACMVTDSVSLKTYRMNLQLMSA